MAIVSVAIIISFHLKNQPTNAEKRIALPVGLVFWVLSIACLVIGCENYVKTVTKYSRRTALVQSGFRTQLVSATRLSGSSLADLCFAPQLTLDAFRYSQLLRLPLSQCAFFSWLPMPENDYLHIKGSRLNSKDVLFKPANSNIHDINPRFNEMKSAMCESKRVRSYLLSTLSRIILKRTWNRCISVPLFLYQENWR